MALLRNVAHDVLIDEALLPKSKGKTIHLSAEGWGNLAVLKPAEHEELDRGAWLEARARFIDDEDTMGLARFIELVDAAGMSTTRSVDLMVWLRRWRAA